jgi:hypothetical protein
LSFRGRASTPHPRDIQWLVIQQELRLALGEFARFKIPSSREVSKTEFFNGPLYQANFGEKASSKKTIARSKR